MQTAFYVSHAGQTYGPWALAEITLRIARMELIATDYVYDDGKNAWVPLMECEAVVEALRSEKPSAPPPRQPVASPAPSEAGGGRSEASPGAEPARLHDASSEDAQWFVQKGAHRYGPFTYLGLIKALQEKSIFDFDLVWNKGAEANETWVRLAEHEMFTPAAIRGTMETAGRESSKFFAARRFPRFPVASEVIAHDNKSVWLGRTYQASEGGSGVTIRNAMLEPGQVLHLHFEEFDGLPAFNAICEVVNKRYVPNVRDPRAAVPYGVRFVDVDKDVQLALKEYGSVKAA